MFACHGPCKFCSGYLPTDAIDIAPIPAQPLPEKQVAKIDDLEKMPYAELTDMEAPDRSAEDQKRNAERNAVRQRLVGLAKEHSLDTHDRFGKGLEGTVAVTYRDPRAPRTPGRDVAACRAGRLPRPRVVRPAGKISPSGDLRCCSGP